MANFLTDIFTGAPGVQAAEQQRAYLQNIMNQVGSIYDTARTGGTSALQAGQTGALGSLGTGIESGLGYLQSSLTPQLQSLFGGGAQGAGALQAGQTGGLGALAGGVQGAVGAYSPLAMFGSQAAAGGTDYANMLRNAYGLNGPAGNQAAVQAFQAGPGYQFQLGQGLDAIARNANASGMAASGNQLRAAQQYGQGLANQEYGNWLSGLTGQQGALSNQGLQAMQAGASGIGNALLTGGTGGANIFTGTGGKLSDLYSTLGAQGANIYGGLGTNLANLAYGGGQGLANIYTGVGGQTANLLGSLAGQQGGQYTSLGEQAANTYKDAAQAQLAGSQNLWGGILGGLQLAAGGGFLPSGGFTPFGAYAPKK